MKLWKYGIILVSVSMLMLPSVVASAETITDGQNDVLLTTDGGISYQTGITKTEIDVKTVTCTFSGSTLILVIEIYGTIQNEQGYEYRALVNTTDSRYTMNYNGGVDLCTAYRFDDSEQDLQPEFSVSGSTITTEFNLLGDTTIVDMVGNTAHVVSGTEMYIDWLPDSRGPSNINETVGDSAETEIVPDGQNDVLKSPQGTCTFERNQSKPDIDVKQITCTIEGTTLTLELEIWDAGTIQQADHYMYYAYVNTTDFQYIISLMNGNDRADIIDRTNPDNMPDTPDLEISAHSISAVFQLQGSSAIDEVWGWGTYVSNPLYQDWAPDSRGPEGSFGEDTSDDDTDDNTTDDDITDDNTTDDDTDDNTTDDDDDESNGTVKKPGIPGFEAVAVLAAIGVVFILIERRRK